MGKSAPDDLHGVLWELSRHLPPGAAQLTVLDVGGNAAAKLVRLRPDLRMIVLWRTSHPTPLHPVERAVLQFCSGESQIPLPDGSIDAVTCYSVYGRLQDKTAFFREAMRVLRPGGRLILFDPRGGDNLLDRIASLFRPRDALAQRALVLKAAGFARALAEKFGAGILSRGEKPYPSLSTVERIARTAALDASADSLQIVDSADLPSIGRGRFVFLLVKQTPDKPPWAIQPGEPIRWDAAMVSDPADSDRPYLIVFSSLPKAVQFMQPAVTAGLLKGVNKVAKFDRSVAPQWATDALLNPPFAVVRASGRYAFNGAMLAVDPSSAVLGEE